MLSHEDAWALFERRRRAWLDEDLPGYLALWTEDMTFQSPMHAEPLRTWPVRGSRRALACRSASAAFRRLAPRGAGGRRDGGVDHRDRAARKRRTDRMARHERRRDARRPDRRLAGVQIGRASCREGVW